MAAEGVGGKYDYVQNCCRPIHRHVVVQSLASFRSYQKCGFVIEGREREAALVDGAWHDDAMMAILDREYLAMQGKGTWRLMEWSGRAPPHRQIMLRWGVIKWSSHG